MAQRDKVKELVGRGLHSYHTKALQQIDRIEKKNKEQNDKISILSNELDNDYLTKTEEGSVISLEHSKEGMVYLDELQGNTLVNYCTDGSKEMTLNGDIDVEGTFVTTTEGVDNGKVDVMCEGNTLVNKLYKIKNYGSITEFRNHGWGSTSNCPNYEWIDNGIKIKALSSDTQLDRYYRSSPDKYGIFKKNRTYIVRMNVNSNNLQQNATILRCFYGNGTTFMTGQMSEVVNGVFIKKATTSSTIEEVDAIHSMISLDYRTPQGVDGWVSFQNVMVIDVTDLPSYQQDVEYWRNIEYFEGMKSVGQDDENGHKIEILSQSKNLVNCSKLAVKKSGVEYTYRDNMIYINGTTVGNYENSYYVPIENMITGEKYTLSYETNNENKDMAYAVFSYYDNNAKKTMYHTRNATFTWQSYYQDAKVYIQIDNAGTSFDNIWYKVQLEKNVNATQYVPYNSNKKEISLNEPLRSVPSGVKDKFVKISGKWFVERNCGEKIFNGDISEQWSAFSQSVNVDVQGFSINVTPKALGKDAQYKQPSTLCDKFKVAHAHENTEHCYFYANEQSIFALVINKTKASDVETLRTWLQNNNVKVVYVLASPIYEEITDVELITYLDTTHISNNSIIPCNMKIKNSGYNAIIKPNTLYTVALDTNKAGTIGMNLGGAKGTTTNNVLKLTTPATLADDSLRLYGKDIKGSKVRILEGDKTNWIPSHFEGMKSSFEDKLQEDGSYKMEILSNNKNLISFSDLKNVVPANGNTKTIYDNGTITIKNEKETTWSHGFIRLKVEPNTTYTIRTKCNVICGNSTVSIREDSDMMMPNVTSQQINEEYITTFNSGRNTIIRYKIYSSTDTSQIGEVKYYDFIMSKVNLNYLENKQNKIQFSSIEPLRKWDRFVFKDGRLMIERNSKLMLLTSDLAWSLNATYKEQRATQFVHRLWSGHNVSSEQTEVFCNKKPTRIGNAVDNGIWIYDYQTIVMQMSYDFVKTKEEFLTWLDTERPQVILKLKEPIYEEIPFELQKIILEGYENGTLFIDTNIPPTSTTTYAGETPIVKSVKLNKTEVLNNTNDINDNIIPYLMDMDYRVVCLQLATEEIEGGVSMARLFGGVYEMLKRDILSKRLSRQEYGYRLADYFNAGKLTEEQVRELEDLR